MINIKKTKVSLFIKISFAISIIFYCFVLYSFFTAILVALIVFIGLFVFADNHEKGRIILVAKILLGLTLTGSSLFPLFIGLCLTFVFIFNSLIYFNIFEFANLAASLFIFSFSFAMLWFGLRFMLFKFTKVKKILIKTKFWNKYIIIFPIVFFVLSFSTNSIADSHKPKQATSCRHNVDCGKYSRGYVWLFDFYTHNDSNSAQEKCE